VRRQPCLIPTSPWRRRGATGRATHELASYGATHSRVQHTRPLECFLLHFNRGRPSPAPCTPGAKRPSHFLPFSPVTRRGGGGNRPLAWALKTAPFTTYALDPRRKAARGLGAMRVPLRRRGRLLFAGQTHCSQL
jgi:hypothetical protein